MYQNPGTVDATGDVATESKQDDIIAILEGSSVNPATNIEGNGTSTVGTTAVELVFSSTTRAVLVSAGDVNLGRVYVGKSDVTSAGANALTFLGAGESLELVYDDVTNPLFVVGSIADQEVLSGAIL